MSFEKALKADNVQEQDYIAPYVANLNTVIDMEAIAAQGLKTVLSNLSPDMVQAQEMAGEKIIAKLTRAPSNGAPIGGLKVVTANGWFAARPSGTENIYKVYAESFQGAEHLKAIQREAQAIVGAALVQAGVAKE